MNQAYRIIMACLVTFSTGILAHAGPQSEGDEAPNNYTTEELTIIVNEMKGSAEKAEQYINLARKFMIENRNYKVAVANAELGLEMAQSYNDVAKEARAWHTLGYCHQRHGALHKAYDAYMHVIPLYQELGDFNNLNSARYNLAYIYTSAKRYQDAEDIYQEVLENYRDNGDMNGVAKAYDAMALLFRSQDRIDDAVYISLKAFTMYTEEEDFDIEAAKVRNLTWRGNTYLEAGQYENAITSFERALKHQANSTNKDDRYGRIYSNLGWAYQGIGDIEKSIEYLTKARAHFIETKSSPRSIAISNLRLAINYSQVGELELSNNLLQANIDLSEDLSHDAQLLSDTYEQLTINQSALGNFEQALAYQKDMMNLNLDEIKLQAELETTKLQYELAQAESELRLMEEEATEARFRFYQWLVLSVAVVGLLSLVYTLYLRIRKQRMVTESILRDFDL